MRHARAEDLARLGEVLARLRSTDGLTEKSPGVFYRGSRAFLHFHVDGDDLYADLKIDTEFERYRVTTVREQQRLVTAARTELALRSSS